MCFRDAEATSMKVRTEERGINRIPGGLNSSSTVHWKLRMSKKESYNEIRIRRRGNEPTDCEGMKDVGHRKSMNKWHRLDDINQ
jgi:hypothetical protein